MANSDTLLAYLVSSFPGNTENIATEALRHIFDQSDATIEALNDVVQSGVKRIEPIQTVQTQVVDTANATVPDLVGFDEKGKERALVEVKFWAQLTPNQPNGYLERLPDDGPAVVIFLAPEDRIQYLWPQLRDRVKSQGKNLIEVDSERKCEQVHGTGKHLMVVSWGSLLDSMATRSRDEGGEPGVETEIRQLRSLARYADAGAFKPIVQDEKIGADSGGRIRQLKQLIDEATERGIGQGWADRKGLRATPRSHGYGRYVRLRGSIVWFGVDIERFEETGDTPLWVDSWYSGQGISNKLAEQLDLQDLYWVPITLRRGAEYREMLEGVVDSLKQIADAIYKAKSPSG